MKFEFNPQNADEDYDIPTRQRSFAMTTAALKSVHAIFENVQKVIRDKPDQIKQILACWIAGGHVLIEDKPGTGKTMLARAIAKSADVDFSRIQMTPDLLPNDILGGSIFNQQKQSFDFIPGPVFTTIFLADELNRASPRTQSALLECMGEGQVSIEGNTRQLNPLFFVIATQNPIEQHGTFPLPEAQLDRFMMKISMGYPSPAQEIEMLKDQSQSHPIYRLASVVNLAQLTEIRSGLSEIKVSDAIYKYATDIVISTRKSPELKLGASPRASLALVKCAQAFALFEGIDHVRPQHVFKLLQPVIAHRISLTAEARLDGKSTASVLEKLIHQSNVPVG